MPCRASVLMHVRAVAGVRARSHPVVLGRVVRVCGRVVRLCSVFVLPCGVRGRPQLEENG